jgi:hypothetical protein
MRAPPIDPIRSRNQAVRAATAYRAKKRAARDSRIYAAAPYLFRLEPCDGYGLVFYALMYDVYLDTQKSYARRDNGPGGVPAMYLGCLLGLGVADRNALLRQAAPAELYTYVLQGPRDDRASIEVLQDVDILRGTLSTLLAFGRSGTCVSPEFRFDSEHAGIALRAAALVHGGAIRNDNLQAVLATAARLAAADGLRAANTMLRGLLRHVQARG